MTSTQYFQSLLGDEDFDALPETTKQEIATMDDVDDRLCLPDDAMYADYGPLEAEFAEEEAAERSVNIPTEAAELVKKINNGDYAKKIIRVLEGLSEKDILRYPISTPQNLEFFFNINKKMAGTCGIEFKEDYKYEFGKDMQVKTRDTCAFSETIETLNKEFNGELFVGCLSKSSFMVVVPDAIMNICRYGANIFYDMTNVQVAYRLMKSVAWKEPENQTKMVDYVVYDRTFHTTSLRVQKQDCDVKLNYNDDLPDERIERWINSKESGLMVLHGEPGTGKTSYIRNLIYRTKNRFMFFDKSLFQHMSDSSLIDMLLEHRNSVIVLEDCEDLLTDRTGLGSCLATILNLTDGILGDSLKFKFICTFNANVVDIDPAILRKGRMRLKYEFGKLNADKVVALGKKLGVEVPHKDMPLCEVYNYTTDNGKPEEKSKVGF